MPFVTVVRVPALSSLKWNFLKCATAAYYLNITQPGACHRNFSFAGHNANKSNNFAAAHTQFIRWKYKKTNSSAEDEDESDSDQETDEFKDDRDSKVIKTSVNSLRLDLVLKSGLGMARNKVEVIFYENKIRVNGEKINKKSMHVEVGDEIDVIKSLSPLNPSHLMVGRIQILSAVEKEQGYRLTMRRYKSLVVDNYQGQNMWKSSGT